MITDARVLQPEFVPNDVVHRNGEIHTLSSALTPVTDGDRAETAILHGPSGTGKTCIAQHTVEHLREEVLDINTQYVNCWEDYSRYKTLYRALEGLDQTFDVHRQSTPTDELLDRLHDYDGPPYVVILDEVDQLESPDVLYDLYRTRRLSMILIANREEELFTNLGGRLNSRLKTSTRLEFKPYSNDALTSILRDRVRWGLRDNAITDENIETIADGAAGDARVAIGILRSAARKATERGRDRLTNELIENAIPSARAEINRKNVEKLTPDQKALYDIITEHGQVAPGDLYEEYRNRVDEPKTERTVRNNLKKMRHYNLIRAEGENRGRTYCSVS